MSDETHNPAPTPDRPGQSALRFEQDAHKIDVVLRLHDQFRSHIQFWHDHVFKAATWSILPAYALIPYYLENRTDTVWWTVMILVGLIGVLSAFYLRSCYRAYFGNWAQIVNCQFALRLHEPNLYFVEQSFFGNEADLRPAPGSAEWKQHVGLHAGDVKVIRLAHGLALLAAVAVLIALRFAATGPLQFVAQ